MTLGRTLKSPVFLLMAGWLLSLGSLACSQEPGLCADSAEALRRLETLLGKFNSTHQSANRLPIEIDTKRVVRANEPEIHLISKGLSVIGNPFAGNGSINFDEISTWSKSVSDVQANGTEHLSTTQSSYSVVRYTITQIGKDWIYHAVNLSNGVPTSVGKPVGTGSVEWIEDGVKLSGVTTIAEFYGPSGEMIPGLSRIKKTMRRDGGQLIVRTESQPYAAARDTQGHLIPSIDEGRPLGNLFIEERKSEPALENATSNSGLQTSKAIRDAKPEEIVRRITTLMSADNKQKLRKQQKLADGMIATIEFPMPSDFREVSMHVFECELPTSIATSGSTKIVVKRLVTRLSSNENGIGTILSEIVLDDSGATVSENHFDVRLWGENGFVSTLRSTELAKVNVGDWVSTEWTKLDTNRVIGINRFHASDRITIWESFDADAPIRSGE